EEFRDGGVAEIGEAEENGIVAESSSQLRFGQSLLCLPAGSGDFHDVMCAAFFERESEDRLKQSNLGIADGELSGVHGNRDSSGAGGNVIAGEGTLAALIQFAAGVEREGVRGD